MSAMVSPHHPWWQGPSPVGAPVVAYGFLAGEMTYLGGDSVESDSSMFRYQVSLLLCDLREVS